MKLGRTEIIRAPEISMRALEEYEDWNMEKIDRLDLLYKFRYRHTSPERVAESITLEDFSARILVPMIENRERRFAAAVGATNPLE